MNLRLFLLAVLACACLHANTTTQAQTSTDPNEGSQLSQDPTTGLYTFSWWGRAGRTYFLQQSDDLINWSYLPVIESGYEQVIQWAFTSSAPTFFVRLKYADIPTYDPFDADFDGDGVSNWNELLQGTDPLSATLDTNGLPLDWEKFYNIPLGTDPNALAPRNDGLTYLQAFQQGLNPDDYYNGQAPAITIVSGTPQSGPANGFVTLPLTVSVKDSYGNPLIYAPVTYTVGQAGGQVQATNLGTPSTSLTVLTDYNGQACVYFILPGSTNTTCQITASAAGSGNYPNTVTFIAASDDGSGTYGSPFLPTNVLSYRNPDGSEDMTWENNTEYPTPITIYQEQSDGSWTPFATLPAGTTSYHIPPP